MSKPIWAAVRYGIGFDRNTLQILDVLTMRANRKELLVKYEMRSTKLLGTIEYTPKGQLWEDVVILPVGGTSWVRKGARSVIRNWAIEDMLDEFVTLFEAGVIEW